MTKHPKLAVIRHLEKFVSKMGSTRDKILIAVMLSMMIFFILPQANENIIAWTNNSSLLPWNWHTRPTQVYHLLSSLGTDAINAYIFKLLFVDLFFMILYSAYASLMISSIAKYSALDYYDRFTILPFLIGFFHLLENCCLSIFLVNVQIRSPIVLRMVAVIVWLKWIIICLVLVAFIWALAVIIAKNW